MEETGSHPEEDTEFYLRKALARWAKLWLLYNAVLLGLGLNLGIYGYHLGPRLGLRWSGLGGVDVLFAVVFGVVANAFYSLGPLWECYSCILFGRRLGRGRYVLFAVGFLFSVFLVFFLWVAYFKL